MRVIRIAKLRYLVVLPELGVVEIIEPVRHPPGKPNLLNKMYATIQEKKSNTSHGGDLG